MRFPNSIKLSIGLVELHIYCKIPMKSPMMSCTEHTTDKENYPYFFYLFPCSSIFILLARSPFELELLKGMFQTGYPAICSRLPCSRSQSHGDLD